jgi:hypothetical protein
MISLLSDIIGSTGMTTYLLEFSAYVKNLLKASTAWDSARCPGFQNAYTSLQYFASASFVGNMPEDTIASNLIFFLTFSFTLFKVWLYELRTEKYL